MGLCATFQEAFGEGSGVALDPAETLDTFQPPGETIDETILRAVRE